MSTENEQVLQAENWGDPNVDMMKAMDEFFEPTTTESPAKEAPVPEVVPVPAKKEPQVIEEVKPIIEEEFFSDAADDVPEVKEEKPEAFDEEAFDKQTEVEVKGMEVKAGEKFRALKAELKAAKQSVLTPEVKTKMEALELKAQEAEGLRLRIAEISASSAKLQVENDDTYQAEVVQPAADIFTRADALATMYDTEPTILRAIIKERDRKVQNELIAEHLADFSDFDRNEAYRMIQDFNGLVTKRDRMMENAEKTIEKSRASKIENDKRLMEDQRRVVQTFQKDIWQKYKEHIPGFVEEGADTPVLKKLMAKALSIDFSQAKARDQAYAAFAGTALPHAVNEIAALKKRLSTYEKGDVKALKQGPGAGASLTATPSGEKAPKTFMEAMAQDYNFA
jgi:hypothetical protein